MNLIMVANRSLKHLGDRQPKQRLDRAGTSINTAVCVNVNSTIVPKVKGPRTTVFINKLNFKRNNL